MAYEIGVVPLYDSDEQDPHHSEKHQSDLRWVIGAIAIVLGIAVIGVSYIALTHAASPLVAVWSVIWMLSGGGVMSVPFLI